MMLLLWQPKKNNVPLDFQNAEFNMLKYIPQRLTA
jgi:hypothetical protein